MSTAAVAAEWQEIADQKYLRRPEVYTMQWGRMDLSRFRIACAPFGGPIAAIRDDSKIVQLLAESARRHLQIFSSSGELIASCPWDRSGGKLVGMAWTDDLQVACLLEDASVHLFNSRAEPVGPAISLGKEPSERLIMHYVFWGTGVACLTETNQVYCIPDFKNPNPCQLADPGIDEADQVFCMAVNEPKAAKFGTPEVLLAVGDSVLLVGEYSAQTVGEGIGPIQKMAVSKEGKFVAMFTGDGRLLVAPMDFSRILFEYDCESALPPDQMVWSSLDSVVLYWEELLSVSVISPAGDPVHYQYDEPGIQLIPECDGVRILSNSSMEFLHLVPESTVSIFGIFETMEPSAILYDAYDNFERRSAKADENLRSIRSLLPKAIKGCIDAAGHEFDVSRQRTLLRAASYGRAFCSQYDRDHFKEMCKTLRVLNAVRDIGIPLSIGQYQLLTAPVLIGRLINANQHFLALRISEYLNLNPEVVIMHWACEKITVSPSVPDDALLEALLEKLKLCKGISYAAIAAHADNSGRRKLAAMLVEHESQSSKQVPLLLSIDEEDTALAKATESGDTDLIYLVLFHIWQKKQPLDFFGTVNARPLARDLFVAYARCYKHEFLKDFFLSTGQLQDVAFLLLKESRLMEKNPMASKGSPLQGPRIRLIEQAHKLFVETKENMFESKASEEYSKLLRVQHELEVSTKQPIFVDSSISDTIRTCIVMGNHRAALKVKNEFKVSEKRWYWLKAFALATVRDWDALEKFSKEKRPPGGYKPFVQACIDAGEKSEALKYIPKLTDPRDKSEAYARIGMAKEAADAGSQVKDSEIFGRLLGQNSGASSIFDSLRDRLSFQGTY
ncbi:vacuoleless1 (VCL1) [Carex rostrata]